MRLYLCRNNIFFEYFIFGSVVFFFFFVKNFKLLFITEMDEKDLQLAQALVGLEINDKPKSVVSKMQDKQQLFRFVFFYFITVNY